jgi:hypothetical protein
MKVPSLVCSVNSRSCQNDSADNLADSASKTDPVPRAPTPAVTGINPFEKGPCSLQGPPLPLPSPIVPPILARPRGFVTLVPGGFSFHGPLSMVPIPGNPPPPNPKRSLPGIWPRARLSIVSARPAMVSPTFTPAHGFPRCEERADARGNPRQNGPPRGARNFLRKPLVNRSETPSSDLQQT